MESGVCAFYVMHLNRQDCTLRDTDKVAVSSHSNAKPAVS